MFGEVFLCQFPFTSGAVSKSRPVLVLFDLQPDAVICHGAGQMPFAELDAGVQGWINHVRYADLGAAGARVRNASHPEARCATKIFVAGEVSPALAPAPAPPPETE